jgi:hypothetical protein
MPPRQISKKGKSQGNKSATNLRGPNSRFLPKPRILKVLAPQSAEPLNIPADTYTPAPTTPRPTAITILENPPTPIPLQFTTLKPLPSLTKSSPQKKARETSKNLITEIILAYTIIRIIPVYTIIGSSIAVFL